MTSINLSNQLVLSALAGGHNDEPARSEEQRSTSDTRGPVVKSPLAGRLSQSSREAGSQHTRQFQLPPATRSMDGNEIFDKALSADVSSLSQADFSDSHRIKRNIPKDDDEYANYVLRVGAGAPLGPTELGRLREGVIRAVISSRGRLIDQHTADMIGNTVLDALSRSQTFRHAVSYGIHNNHEPLADITYRNEYERNPESTAELGDIQELSIDELHEHDAQSAPIIPVSEAAEDSEGRPYVSFSVAPDSGSPDMPSWQEGLIHEIIHHVTGAGDPPGAGVDRLGPTEILARRVAQEMGWGIPDFTGYGAPARYAHLSERNLGALREAAQRHGDHEAAFFERLDTIADGGEASLDFMSSGIVRRGPSQNQVHQNQTDDFPRVQNSVPLPDEHEIELDHRPPYLFTFASSSPSGASTGIQSASAARDASWGHPGPVLPVRKTRGWQPACACVHVPRWKQSRCEGA